MVWRCGVVAVVVVVAVASRLWRGAAGVWGDGDEGGWRRVYVASVVGCVGCDDSTCLAVAGLEVTTVVASGCALEVRIG
ncbi:hypothetical protein Tco_0981025 [Tanacetum coccineum]